MTTAGNSGGRLVAAIVQMEIADGDWRANVDSADRMLAAGPPADLYVLPELWTTGYAFDAWRRAATEGLAPTLEWMRGVAHDRQATLAGSIVSFNDDGRLVNRLWVVGNEATSFYDKIHLFPPLSEPDWLAPGRERRKVQVAGMTCGLSICFDLRFPAMYRLDAREGAEAFIVSSEWPAARADALRTLCRARAIENQSFVLLSNRTGAASDGVEFNGQSMVVSPSGEILSDMGTGVGIGAAVLDVSSVRELRRAIPVLAPELDPVGP